MATQSEKMNKTLALGAQIAMYYGADFTQRAIAA
jgi:hypothetical protein